MTTAFGMMDGTYFVSRGELLAWLNDLLDLDYTKIEQICNGAALCQIFDCIFPGTVPLSKVNFDSKLEYKWIDNFKVLQKALEKNNIDKEVPVAKLIKGLYQDNLEMLQWVKKFFDVNYKGEPYNAIEKRKAAQAPYASDKGKSGRDFVGGTPAPASLIKDQPASSVKKPASATKASPSVKSPTTTKKPTPVKATTPIKSPTPTGKAPDESKVQELNQQMADLKVTVDTLERERDFYFGKLRDIEILTQSYEGEGAEIINQIQKILYATDDEAGNATGEEAVAEQPPEEEAF